MPLTHIVRKLLPLEFSFLLIAPRRRSQLGANRSLTPYGHLLIAIITVFTGVGSELLAGLLGTEGRIPVCVSAAGSSLQT